MTGKNVRLYSDRAGEIVFDGIHAVAAALDVGYPEIKRIRSDTVSVYSERTHAVCVGGAQLVFEGYLLGELLVSDGENGTYGAYGAERATKRGGTDHLAASKALLTSICAPGQEFFLEVGGKRRALYASELTFSSESPFGPPTAEKFCLKAFSDNPFFHADATCVGGEARAQSALTFPASGGFSTATQSGVCDVRIKNDGDELCGFVLEAEFAADTMYFRLSSDRDKRSLHVISNISAGEKVIISTIPGDQYVKKENGTSLLYAISEGCVFHTLAPGETCITFKSFSSVPPAVQVSFTPGYLIP